MREPSASSRSSSSRGMAASANLSFSRSASGRPRHRSRAARYVPAASSSRPASSCSRPPSRSSRKRKTSSSANSRLTTYPGARVNSTSCGSSCLRSRDTCCCRAVCASSGGSSPQSSSIRRSDETTSPACKSRIARTLRCFAPPRRISRSPSRTSSGPRMWKSRPLAARERTYHARQRADSALAATGKAHLARSLGVQFRAFPTRGESNESCTALADLRGRRAGRLRRRVRGGLRAAPGRFVRVRVDRGVPRRERDLHAAGGERVGRPRGDPRRRRVRRSVADRGGQDRLVQRNVRGGRRATRHLRVGGRVASATGR